MTASPRWDWAAVRAGAAVSLVFALPLAIGARIAGNGDHEAVAVGLSIGATIAFFVGAGCAAWIQRVGFPLSHGLVTAGGTYVAAQAVFIVVRLARGEEVRWFAAMFTLDVRDVRRFARRVGRPTLALGRNPTDTSRHPPGSRRWSSMRCP